jgi:hypothetical protein
MAQPKAKLYQRLRSPDFQWIICETAKNGSPKPRPEALQFGVCYSLNGKRKLDTAAGCRIARGTRGAPLAPAP